MKLLLFLLSARCLVAFDYEPASMHHVRNAVNDMSPWSNPSNPSFLPLWTSAHCTGLYCKPFMIEGLESSSLTAGLTLGDFGFEAGWSTFGIREYREHTTVISAGWRPFKALSMGTGLTYYRLEIAADEIDLRSDLFDCKASILLMPFEWLALSFIQQNLHSIFDENRRDLLYPSWSIGVAASPVPGLHLSWGLTDSGDAYVNTASVSVNILECLNIKAGYSREVSTGTLSASVLYRHILLTYSLGYHTYLGASHTFSATITLDEGRFAAMQYGRMPRRPSGSDHQRGRTIDINSCAREELNEVPALTGIMADRIMAYRARFGKVSAKVLAQLGMNEREVRDLQEHLCGLEPDAPDDSTQREIRKRHGAVKNSAMYSERKKRIFQRLVNRGISAGLALSIADLSEKHDVVVLRKLIEARSDIPPETRSLISSVCTASY